MGLLGYGKGKENFFSLLMNVGIIMLDAYEEPECYIEEESDGH